MFFILMMSVAQQAATRAAGVSEELLLMIAKGDMTAFSDFYNQTKTAVYSFALSILKSPHEAEDVMQDTYLKIHANAGRYIPGGKPLAWVFTITRNLCLMRLRSAKNNTAEYLDELDYVSTKDFAGTVEDSQIIASAMTVLSDEERQIVVMHAVAGLKHKDIGAMLSLPLATVLSKYNRALHKMRKHLTGGDI